jgi:hypothetical protein
MTICNYVPCEIDTLDPQHAIDELFDLDLLCGEEGIFINIPEEQAP